MTYPLTTQGNDFQGRRRLGAKLLLAWLVPLLLLQPAAMRAATLTNADFGAFLSAVQSGSAVFGTNAKVVFDDVLVVTTNATIDATGFNVVLSGNNSLRLFEVRTNVSLTLINLVLADGNVTFTNGASGADGSSHSNSGDSGGNGTSGASATSGAIYNEGTLNLTGCTLTNNSVVGGDGGDGGNGGSGAFQGGNGGNAGDGGKAQGGAIYNIGFVSITNCMFSGNEAAGGSGGVGGAAGSGGFTYDGGGGGGAEGAGAAVYNLGTARIFSSTFFGNVSSGGTSEKAKGSGTTGGNGKAGGAGLGAGICNLNTLTIVNCTFAGNEVFGGNGGDGGDGDFNGGNGGNGGLASGGGIYSAATAFVTNCTFSVNAAFGGTNGVAGGVGFPGSDGSAGAKRGANIAGNAGRLVLANSILADGANGGNAFRTVVTNIFDAGYNISSDNSLNLTNTGSLKNTNPKLSALRYNGGPTPTIMPQLGSPAINRSSAGGYVSIDQRGFLRLDGTNDAGAVETLGLRILTNPPSQTVAVGATVLLGVSAAGEQPLAFQWRFNNSNINRATNATLTLSNFQLTNAGSFLVVVTNSAGSITSAPPAVIKVIAQDQVKLSSPSLSGGTNFLFTFKTTNGFNYYLEYKDALSDANWLRLKTNAGNGNIITNLLPITGTTNRFFRITVQ